MRVRFHNGTQSLATMMRALDAQRSATAPARASGVTLRLGRCLSPALPIRRTCSRQQLGASRAAALPAVGIRHPRSGVMASAEASTSSAQQPCRAAFLALACMQSFKRTLVGTPEILDEQHAGAGGGRRLPLALGGFVMCVCVCWHMLRGLVESLRFSVVVSCRRIGKLPAPSQTPVCGNASIRTEISAVSRCQLIVSVSPLLEVRLLLLFFFRLILLAIPGACFPLPLERALTASLRSRPPLLSGPSFRRCSTSMRRSC